MEIDFTICPHCGDDEETYLDSDWIYEYGYIIRHCDKCDKSYKVYFKSVATRVEKELK